MTSGLRIGNDWSCLLDFSEPRYGYTMVAIGNDQIGFVGGYCHGTSPTNRTTLRTVTVYNLVSKSYWSFEMFEKRCDREHASHFRWTRCQQPQIPFWFTPCQEQPIPNVMRDARDS